ncbi:MAG: hypothetical protein A2Z08_00940 [Deltaproteobacteria bacterium RBG_16_54_11]|nr:MAG: hypothetical protein A2Z08_00940 [Deltaproteobacteria bacterium RBG_16_54_11]
MSLPLSNVCRNKDDGRKVALWPQYRDKVCGIPAALRHHLIKNLKVGEQAGKATQGDQGPSL